MKKCTTCGEIKPLEDFYPDKSKTNGFSARCKVCICAAQKAKYIPKPPRPKKPPKICEFCGEEYESNQSRSRFCSSRCSGNRRLKRDTIGFIKEAKQIHGDRYDYSKTQYLGERHLLTITCHAKDDQGVEHGDWETYPTNHLGLKCGCNKCGYMRIAAAANTPWEEWLAKAILKHGKKYDYKLAKENYVNGDSLLTIGCPDHGPFQQIAGKHLQGGCMKCGGRMKLTRDEFIKKSRDAHGDTYDYSKVVYVNNEEPVEIICQIHGSFLQKPSTHMAGANCRICSGTEPYTATMFIEAARKIHGNKYDYSKVTYLETLDYKVEISCPKHGVFRQIARYHKLGRGCRKCKESRGETMIRVHLESRGIPHEQYYREKNGRRFEYDFLMGQTVIELYGEQHYMPPTWLASKGVCPESYFQKVLVNDYEKLKINQSKNRQTLIIPYWERDRNRVGVILDAYLSGEALVFSEPPKEIKKHAKARKAILRKAGFRGPEILFGLT
jgi:hypothetical protein